MTDPLTTLQIMNETHAGADEMPSREEAPYLSRRLTLLVVIFCLVIAVFMGRVYQLTILEGPKYRETSDENFLLQEPIIAPRGRILDCKGRPLAINQTLFDVQMSRFNLKPPEIRATLDRVAALLGRPQIRDKFEQVIAKRPKWESISLLDRKLVPLAEVLPVLEQAMDLPGIIPVSQYRRYYPAGNLAGLVTGHVGQYGIKQKEKFEALGYLPDEKIGQMGAEQTFEPLLHGEHGIQTIQRDAQGRPREAYVSQPCKAGAILTLTLDLEMQRLADALLGDYKGVIVAMDPRDGAVLAMAAHPNYDPNDPAGRRAPPGVKYDQFNKVTRGLYAPGSTFKIITAAAGLAAGYAPLDGIDCDGVYTIPGTTTHIKCTGHHASANLYDALQKSCNVFFMSWAYRMRGDNGDKLVDMARNFGFGERTGFELIQAEDPRQENPGIAGKDNRPPLGNIVMMGIGQGELIDVTPLQVARAYAALCNGGILYQPRILKEAHTPDLKPIKEGKPVEQGRLPLSDLQRSQILEGLRRVVNEPGGTAARYGIKPEWRVSGKTGTAQLGGPKVNAWFVGFAPAEAPTILLTILVENSPSHGGTMCAPLARQLLAYYFGQPEPQIWPAGTEPPKKDGEEDSHD